MADVFDFLSNLKKPIFETPPITYGDTPPQIKVADPNNPLGKLSLPPPDAGISLQGAATPAPALQTPVTTNPPKTSDIDDDILSKFSPESRAQDELYKMLQNTPQYHRPGLGTRIVAGLSTLAPGGQANADRLLDNGYSRQRENFNTKLSVLGKLADTEKAGNTNERLVLSQLLSDRRNARHQDEVERHNQETEKAARNRNELSAFLAQNPNYQLKTDENGEFVAFNPKEPTKPPIKTGVKSGEMSELAKLMMVQSAANQRQFTQADLDRQMEELRQQHRKEIEELQAKLKIDTERNKPETPTETRIRRFNSASQLLNSDPDNQRYIVLGQPGTNDFELKLPLTPFWKSDAEKKAKLDKFEELNRQIYGSDWKKQNPEEAKKLQAARGTGGNSARSTPTPSGQKSNVIRQRNTATGAIRESTDGGKTWKIIQAGR